MTLEAADRALKLRAEDDEDLRVISACLQDSLVLVGNLAYVPEEKSFMLVANRFRWEGARRPRRGHERTLAGIVFKEVEGVSYRGFRKSERARILSLLAVRAEAAAGETAILLEFSAGAVVRLAVTRIACRLRDLSEPWPAGRRPTHETGDEA
jgi:hypothetical protein